MKNRNRTIKTKIMSLGLPLFFTISLFLSGNVSAQSILTYEQKFNAIESLKEHEEQVRALAYNQNKDLELSSTHTETNNNLDSVSLSSSVVSSTSLDSNTVAVEKVSRNSNIFDFQCNEGKEDSCEMQKFLHRMENGQRSRVIDYAAHSGFYKVIIFFINDSDFPTKYVRKETIENISEHNRENMQERIFENYLGTDFFQLKPELLSVSLDTVGIAIYVASSEELTRFLSDDKVTGIHHLGNDKNVKEAPL